MLPHNLSLVYAYTAMYVNPSVVRNYYCPGLNTYNMLQVRYVWAYRRKIISYVNVTAYTRIRNAQCLPITRQQETLYVMQLAFNAMYVNDLITYMVDMFFVFGL